MQAQPQQSGVGPSRGWAARARPQLPRPAFGSSPNLQALVLEAEERAEGPSRDANLAEAAFFEVTIASADQPKLLSRLSEALVSSPAQCLRVGARLYWLRPQCHVMVAVQHTWLMQRLASFACFCQRQWCMDAARQCTMLSLTDWQVRPSQGDLNLNIAEAHAFNTTDRFTLDVFVVNGWANGGVEELEEVLSQRLQVTSVVDTLSPISSTLSSPTNVSLIPTQTSHPALSPMCRSYRRPVCVRRAQARAPARPGQGSSPSSSTLTGRRCAVVRRCICWLASSWLREAVNAWCRCYCDHDTQSMDASMAPPDDWELDPSEIKFQEKIASGAFGDLYKGSYCGQVCVNID